MSYILCSIPIEKFYQPFFSHVLSAAPLVYTRMRRCQIVRVTGGVYVNRTRKKFILEELPNSSETEDMRKIR